MRIFFIALGVCAAVTVGPLSVGKSYSEASGCLNAERSVNLTGFLSRETYPGRPNYMSIEGGDKPETGYYLRLRNPICIEGINYETRKSYLIDGIKKLQIFSINYRIWHPIKNYNFRKTRVIIKGKPYKGFTRKYHASHGAAILADGVKAAKK